MPVLPNARHERFAQGVAAGRTAVAAHAAAGYRPSKKSAWLVRRRPDVAERIAELQSAAAERVELTVGDIVRQLAEDRALAWKTRTASAAVSASLGQAKVLGLLVERTVNDHTHRAVISDQPLSEDEWAATHARLE